MIFWYSFKVDIECKVENSDKKIVTVINLL